MAFKRVTEVQPDCEALLQTGFQLYLLFGVKLDLYDSFIGGRGEKGH